MSDLTLGPTPARLAASITRLLTASENAATRGSRAFAMLYARKAVEASSALHQLTLESAIEVATSQVAS